MDLKRSLEAILFASAQRLTTHKLAILTRKPEEEVEKALEELQKEIEEGDRPAKLIRENDTWRLSVKEQFLPVVRKIVTKTEMPKSVLETLAVVAYKAPVLQSKVIKIRTNKAYDHLNRLEEAGFITREKHGRTKMIRLGQKFYEYFDIDPERLKGKFKNAEDIEKAIERKEEEVMRSGKGPIEEYESIETYEQGDEWTSGVKVYKETMGELDVYESIPEIPKEEMLEEIKEAVREAREIEKEAEEKKPEKKESKGLEIDEDMEKRVDRRVQELLGKAPEKEEKE